MSDSGSRAGGSLADASIGRSAVRGTVFAYVARYGGQGLGFISTIVLARTLSQEQFGLAGFALVVTGFLDILRGLGIGAAVIYLGDEPRRRDTAFQLAVVSGMALYAITWGIAPLAASFFGDYRVTEMTRVVALTFPIAALSTVHRALLDKRLAFGRRLVPELGRGAGKAAVAIVLALAGFGAWSIVWGQVAGVAVESMLLWRSLSWRPSLRVHRGQAGPLLGYGWRSALVDLFGVLLLNVDYLIVGKIMGASALGLYTVAFRVPELVVKQLGAVVGSVTFPVYAALRHDEVALRNGYLKSLRYLSLALTPMATGIVLVAEPAVVTLFGQRWIEAAPVMQALAIYAWVRGLTYGSGSLLRASGRPGVLTSMSALQLALLVPALWWSASATGALAVVAWVQVLVAMLTSVVRLTISAGFIGVSLAQQLRSLGPAIGTSLIMVVSVSAVGVAIAHWTPQARLPVLVLTGAASYVAALWFVAAGDIREILARARRAFTPT